VTIARHRRSPCRSLRLQTPKSDAILTRAWVNGVPRSLLDILQDPQLAGLLTREGVIRHLGTLIDDLSHREQ
jgi:hypothetical protein